MIKVKLLRTKIDSVKAELVSDILNSFTGLTPEAFIGLGLSSDDYGHEFEVSLSPLWGGPSRHLKFWDGDFWLPNGGLLCQGSVNQIFNRYLNKDVTIYYRRIGMTQWELIVSWLKSWLA